MPVVAQLMGMATSGGYTWRCPRTPSGAPTTVTGQSASSSRASISPGSCRRSRREPDADLRCLQGRRQPAAPDALRGARATPSVIATMYQRFLASCAGSAEADAGADRDAADGRIYSADQALENGLVDRLGSIEDAVADASSRGPLDFGAARRHVPPPARVPHGTSTPRRLRPSFLRSGPPARGRSCAAGVLYLWAPNGLLE